MFKVFLLSRFDGEKPDFWGLFLHFFFIVTAGAAVTHYRPPRRAPVLQKPLPEAHFLGSTTSRPIRQRLAAATDVRVAPRLFTAAVSAPLKLAARDQKTASELSLRVWAAATQLCRRALIPDTDTRILFPPQGTSPPF